MLAVEVMMEVLDREPPKGNLRYLQSTIQWLQRLADGLLIVAGLGVAGLLAHAQWSASIAIAGAVGVVLFYCLAEIKYLYKSWRTESVWAEVWRAVETWLGVAGLSLVAIYVQRDTVAYPPDTLLYWFIGVSLLLAIWRLGIRYAVRWARVHGRNTRAVAIAGSGELAWYVARIVKENPWMGFRFLGLYDDNESNGVRTPTRSELRGSLEALIDQARSGALDVVLIALPPGRAELKTDLLVRRLADSTSSVYLVQDRRSRVAGGEQGSRQILPDLWRLDILQRRCMNLGGIKAVSLYESPFHGPVAWLKRLEDILVGSVAMVLLGLPMAAIACGVKLSSPGPALFKQRRYGLDGREIMVWKFRSMSVCEDGDKIAQARKEDDRVTRLGRILRRTSLDELPQFLNVLQGSMSIVGPRPHAVAHNEHYRGLIGGYMLRHKVKPGITGWAQINGWRGETESVDKMGRRVDFDLDYIRNWSLRLDIWIILLTAVRGFTQKNAY